MVLIGRLRVTMSNRYLNKLDRILSFKIRRINFCNCKDVSKENYKQLKYHDCYRCNLCRGKLSHERYAIIFKL